MTCTEAIVDKLHTINSVADVPHEGPKFRDNGSVQHEHYYSKSLRPLVHSQFIFIRFAYHLTSSFFQLPYQRYMIRMIYKDNMAYPCLNYHYLLS